MIGQKVNQKIVRDELQKLGFSIKFVKTKDPKWVRGFVVNLRDGLSCGCVSMFCGGYDHIRDYKSSIWDGKLQIFMNNIGKFVKEYEEIEYLKRCESQKKADKLALIDIQLEEVYKNKSIINKWVEKLIKDPLNKLFLRLIF